MCPIVASSSVRGTFRLTRSGADPLYEYYEVTDVNWKVVLGTSNLRVTGSGTYRIGGEFAVQHQLSLDLEVDDRPIEHYDSGLVAGGGSFPAIDIEISIHGHYCLDTVFDIHAKPLLRIGVSSHDVSWDAMSGATGYDVVRGDLQVLRQTRGNFAAATSLCVANDVPGTSVPSGVSPTPGAAFWFLAREIEGGNVDTYDSDDAGQVGSCDAGISASPASCP
ncbi:MAG TPA: hypothetical protein VII47_16065 [Actinomycetota bacterium]|jgi:hypothetical protein